MAGIKINDPSILRTYVSGDNIIPTAVLGNPEALAIKVKDLVGYVETKALDNVKIASDLLGISSILEFTELKSYLVPDLCLYLNKLYRFINPHFGPWDFGDVALTDIYTEFSTLRGAEQETVTVVVLGNDSFEVSNKEVVISIDNGSPITKLTNSEGKAVFTVPSGARYTLSSVSIEGYDEIPVMNFKATSDIRFVYIDYISQATNIQKEHVSIHLLAQSGNESINVPDVLKGKEVQVNISGMGTLTLITNDKGVAEIDIIIGSQFNITFPKIDKYVSPNLQLSYTAQFSSRAVISPYYKYYGDEGVYMIDLEGRKYDYASWIEDLTLKTLIAIYIAPNKNAIEATLCAPFYIKVNESTGAIDTTSKLWANQNVQFASIPIKNTNNINNADSCHYLYNGVDNTSKIITEGDERGLSTPAADYCYYADGTGTDKTRRTLQIGGTTVYGFLPEFGLIWKLKEVLSTVNTCLGINGKSLLLVSGYWWSATLHSAAVSWTLGSGSPGNSGYGKTNPFTVLPFYA